MKKLLVVLLVAAGFGVKGQVIFQKIYNYLSFNFGTAATTSDGGYILFGAHSVSTPIDSLIFIKTNNLGDTLWTRFFNMGSYEGFNVEQTIDGGYISACTAGILKLNSLGHATWAKTFSTGNGWSKIHQTTDQGYILIGNGQRLYKLNGSGNTMWGKRSWYSYFVSVQQTYDGGYIIGGSTEQLTAGVPDFCLTKMDGVGNLIWSKAYGTLNWESLKDVQQTQDGGYIAVGQIQGFGAGGLDIYVIRTDYAGNLLWSKTYGNIDVDNCYSVKQTTDGGFIICGITFGFQSTCGVKTYLLKINSSGNMLWSKGYGSGCADNDGGTVSKTSDGGYVAGGYDGTSLGYLHLIKTDNNGNSGCQEYTTNFTQGSPPTIELAFADSIYDLSDTTIDILVSESSGTTILPLCIGYVGLTENSNEYVFSIYPNPTTSTFTIESESPELGTELKIYDITGRLAYSTTLASTSSATKVTLNPKLGAGVYFVRVEDGERVQTEKLIVQ